MTSPKATPPTGPSPSSVSPLRTIADRIEALMRGAEVS